MTKINILSPLLADMIAAGEVVERPASVIKELMENSFDAGAKKITVELRGGGAPYIRVTDDGCGMSPDDAGVAFMRHATSKLRDEKGLEAIGTMGFRGEALAAIAAVSHIELVTREKGAEQGIRVSVSAGDIVDMLPCGCPEGTSITVRDIFHNTPARLKFLKSDRSEASACISTALHCALGRPEVSVKCIRDGNEEFFTPGDGRAESAVYSLLGRETAGSLLPCRGDNGEGISLSGFTSSPSYGRGSRSQQFFYCNGRYIKSALLQSAVEQAYRNTLLTGRFPACVMYLRLSSAAVDVNVHPAKTEVRFTEEKRVFDLVYQTVRSALEAENSPLEIKLSAGTKKAVSEPRADFFKTAPASSYRELAGKAASERQQAPSFRAPEQSAYRPVTAPKTESFAKKPEKSPVGIEKVASSDCRVVGEVLNTYIVVEDGEKMVLIDKHAAHERMIFDRLKKQEREIMSQTLLEPVIIKSSAGNAEILENNTELLSSLGFGLEPFGADSFALRAIPDDIDAGEARSAVEELCEKLAAGVKLSPENARDELLHTVACKAAIKAGRRHDPAELRRIADAVMSGAVRYCPHGRPVSAELTKKELDRLFGRIV